MVDQTYGFGGVLKTQTNNLGHTIRNTIDYRGRITTTQDPSGVKKVKVYDDYNRVTEEKIVGNIGRSPQTVAKHAYQASTMPFYTSHSLYNSSGGIDSTSYVVSDGLGHEAQAWTQDMSGDYVSTSKIYDVRGNLIQKGHPVFAGVFVIPSSITVADTLTRSYYDAFGKTRESIKDVSWGTGSSLLYLDEPWESLSIDEAEYFTKLYYDAHGRIIKVKQGQMVQGDTGTATLMAQYQYDPMNRLVKYIDANNNVLTYSYDGLGRLRQVNRQTASSPLEPWYTYEYNGAWRIRMTDNTGAYTYWEYDEIGRPIHIEMTDPLDTTDGIAEYELTYDTVLTGALSQAEDQAGTTDYTYDRYGRVKTTTRSFTDYPSITFSYEYDLQGKQTNKTFPSGYQIASTYSYGWLQSHTGMNGSTPDFSITYNYNDWGLMSSATSSMGHRFSQAYTTPLWPDQLKMRYGLQEYTQDYRWYGNGLMQQKEDGTNSIDYSYDQFKELTEVTQNGTQAEHYAYDAAGNLTQMFADSVMWNYATVGNFNQIPNRTSGASTDNYFYDTTGRVTTWETDGLSREYQYDGMGRLRAISNNGTLVEEIYYDSDGQIVKRSIDNSGTMLSHYSFLDWRYNSDTGTQTEVYTNMVAAENGTKRWLFKEADGHAAITLSDAGVLVGSRQEGAFGLEQAITGTPFALNTFHGTEKESSNELYAMGQRHLMQKDGQWLQPEPLLYLGNIPQKNLASPLSLATNRYAMNSPPSVSDTSGMDPEETTSGSTGGETTIPIQAPVDPSLTTEPIPIINEIEREELLESLGAAEQPDLSDYCLATIMGMQRKVYEVDRLPSWREAMMLTMSVGEMREIAGLEFSDGREGGYIVIGEREMVDVTNLPHSKLIFHTHPDPSPGDLMTTYNDPSSHPSPRDWRNSFYSGPDILYSRQGITTYGYDKSSLSAFSYFTNTQGITQKRSPYTGYSLTWPPLGSSLPPAIGP